MNKKISITLLIILVLIILLSVSVQAYQSIPTGTVLAVESRYLLRGVRKMEATTGGMGLNEKINESTLLPTTNSNNIDVHMQKNTEYGAAVLLSASAYGKQGNGTAGSNYVNRNTYGLATSTGNVYGIYELGQATWEFATAIGPGYSSRDRDLHNYMDSRYYDNMKTGGLVAKTGDATTPTAGWHGGTTYWYGAFTIVLRGNNSAYSYRFRHDTVTYSSRAAIVSGEGF